MKMLAFIPMFLVSAAAHADVIKCFFTEPFVNSTYDTKKAKLVFKDSADRITIYPNATFEIKGPADFEIRAKDGTVLQTLKLDNQGSDGMSDFVYPYSVKDDSGLTGSPSGYGGCESNHLKRTEPPQ